jgi:glycosyltransferase involved in cell wall biosynthesis
MVVIPSVTSETFSLSMVEAWSIGIPTIATNNFGMKELVDTFLPEYASYLLFKLGSANDLCAKMKELLGDDKLYHELSNRLYSVVKDSFSDKNYMESLCKIIRDI